MLRSVESANGCLLSQVHMYTCGHSWRTEEFILTSSRGGQLCSDVLIISVSGLLINDPSVPTHRCSTSISLSLSFSFALSLARKTVQSHDAIFQQTNIHSLSCAAFSAASLELPSSVCFALPGRRCAIRLVRVCVYVCTYVGVCVCVL